MHYLQYYTSKWYKDAIVLASEDDWICMRTHAQVVYTATSQSQSQSCYQSMAAFLTGSVTQKCQWLSSWAGVG